MSNERHACGLVLHGDEYLHNAEPRPVPHGGVVYADTRNDGSAWVIAIKAGSDGERPKTYLFGSVARAIVMGFDSSNCTILTILPE